MSEVSRNIISVLCITLALIVLLVSCGKDKLSVLDPADKNDPNNVIELPDDSFTETTTQTTSNTVPSPNPNACILVNKMKFTLLEGESDQIIANVIPKHPDDSTVLTFEADSDCIRVDADGKITAIKAGTAQVTVSTPAGLTVSVTVEVSMAPNPDASLVLDKSEVTLNVDDAYLLYATYIPRFATDDTTLYWTSENTAVVSVDENGCLKANAPGEATVICGSSDENFYAECKVTVKLMWKNYSYAFKANLSEYEWAMNPESDAYVFLVNKNNPVGRDYVASDLVSVRDTRKDGRDAQKLRKIAEAALHALFLEAEANGMLYENTTYGQVLSVTSGYRSYNQQEYNFNNKVNSLMKADPSMTKAEAEAKAAETINRPGTSEHQTGLCLDMHNLRTAERELATVFGESEAGKWLAENCYKFGYILRYEADKTAITGIAYESWHFRYVGRYHATRMYELDMCLEEYTDYLNEMGYEFDLTE